MLDWLKKKGQDSRVYMCIKEVKWTLESASQADQATILALAQLLRVRMIEDSCISSDVLSRPLDYSRNDLMVFYELLETIRNRNTMKIEQTKQGMRRLGMEVPQLMVDHTKNATRGLEVWMCTLGAGICPDRRDDVRAIWMYLNDASSNLPHAISQLKIVEQNMAAATVAPEAGMFGSVGTDEWIEWCRFIPSIFTKDIALRD